MNQRETIAKNIYLTLSYVSSVFYTITISLNSDIIYTILSKALLITSVLLRCATGEAWPNIMLSCQAGRPCDFRAHRDR